ncbi:MAG: LPS assembly lipoprotein LptE [Pseudomonadota bacterium]
MSLYKQLLACLLAAALSGCGFQLAGTEQIAPELGATYLETDDEYSEFYRKFSAALRQRGVILVTERAKARSIFRLKEDETGQRVLSVSAQNVPREYEVYYAIAYDLSVDGAIRSGANDLTLTRDYTWSEAQVLGKQREETVLRSALVDELVAIVIRRLAYSD